jgi:hypothetical protein
MVFVLMNEDDDDQKLDELGYGMVLNVQKMTVPGTWWYVKAVPGIIRRSDPTNKSE